MLGDKKLGRLNDHPLALNHRYRPKTAATTDYIIFNRFLKAYVAIVYQSLVKPKSWLTGVNQHFCFNLLY